MIKKFKYKLSVFMMLVISLGLSTEVMPNSAGNNGAIYKQTVDVPMDKVYPSVYSALEEARFYVVFEPYISKSISRFKEKWGDDYNRNKLTGIRSMVFCNGWYANKVSNADPDMLALCPLSLSLYEKSGKTTIVFVRPSVVAEQSRAKGLLLEIENEVIDAIKRGVRKVD